MNKFAAGDDLARIVGWISSYVPEAVWSTQDRFGQVQREWKRDEILALIESGRLLIVGFGNVSSGRIIALLDGKGVDLHTLYWMRND